MKTEQTTITNKEMEKERPQGPIIEDKMKIIRLREIIIIIKNYANFMNKTDADSVINVNLLTYNGVTSSKQVTANTALDADMFIVVKQAITQTIDLQENTIIKERR